jgi:hypothetical protein
MGKEEYNKKQGIYIELDALLDTRLATIFLMGEDKINEAFNEKYFERKTDTFKGVDKEEFDKAYKARDKNTLRQAVVTKAIGFIKELVITMTSQAVNSPVHAGPKIFINTYPYALEKEEENAIVEGMVYATNKVCDIQAVNMPPATLTPQFIKDNLSILFMYDYAPWLEAQAENFQKTPCPQYSVIVPGIYFIREPTPAEMVEMIRDTMHPLRMLEMVSSTFIDLKLYDIDLFCASIRIEKVKA